MKQGAAGVWRNVKNAGIVVFRRRRLTETTFHDSDVATPVVLRPTNFSFAVVLSFFCSLCNAVRCAEISRQK